MCNEIASGTPVLDWTVPPEWNVRDAYIEDASGKRVVDFRASNLHVVSYSVPVHARLSRQELDEHLYSLPDRPSLIPYRTSYYNEAWGFCLSDDTRRSMADGEYEVSIDSTLEPGYLTYGECILPGDTTDEVLISTHVCHPSLGERQSYRHRSREPVGRDPLAARASLHIPVSLHPSHHRLDYLAGTQ